MSESRPERKQKTQPKGKDKRTGKPAEPLEIPVPKRGDFSSLLKKAARKLPQSR